MSKITWIGTGVMGTAMVKHLGEAGHEIRLFNRTKSKAEAAAQNMGSDVKVEVFDNIAGAVADADFIFTIVGYPKDVEEVIAGDDGILNHAKSGSIVVDMTTSSPGLAEKLFKLGQERGIEILDAPVSGGDSGAAAGSLSIMVGGSDETFNETLDLFKLMGSSINYMGPAGSGQHTKAANQIAITGAVASVMETLTYAVKTGLDPNKVLDVLSGGAASSWQLINNGPKALAKDYAPGFFIKHFIKDMKIANEEMLNRGEELEILKTVLGIYEEFAAAGHEDEGTQALIQYYLDEDELEAL